jgi:hypothetical protein
MAEEEEEEVEEEEEDECWGGGGRRRVLGSELMLAEIAGSNKPRGGRGGKGMPCVS